MKHLLSIALALMCGAAFGTGKTPTGNASSEANARAQSIDYYDGGRSYALLNASRAAPMPSTSRPKPRYGVHADPVRLAHDRPQHGSGGSRVDKTLRIHAVPAPTVLPATAEIHPKTIADCMPIKSAKAPLTKIGGCKL